MVSPCEDMHLVLFAHVSLKREEETHIWIRIFLNMRDKSHWTIESLDKGPTADSYYQQLLLSHNKPSLLP